MWCADFGRMRIAVISDLHIGADDFSPTGFGKFLDHLEREHDEIILLGDVFECYFPVLPWRALAEYDRLDRLHRDITHRFRSDKYTILSGNHDMVVRRARGIPSRTVTRTSPPSAARPRFASSSGTCGWSTGSSAWANDAVVFGHTHVARHVELRQGGTYVNTGDCVRRRIYASLDLERRECRLFEFPGRRVTTEQEE